MTRKLFRTITILITFTAVLFVFASINTYAASVSNASGQVNAKNGATLRKSSSTSSKKIIKLKNNTNLVIKKEVFKKKNNVNKKNKWYYVTANGKTGYIRADLVDNIKYTPVAAKITGKVNYRIGAGTKMTKKGSYKKGKEIKVYLKATPLSSCKGSSSTWYKIKVGSKYRYLCSKYVTLITPASPKTTGVVTPTVSNPAPTISVSTASTATALPATGQINSSNGVNIRSQANTSSTIIKCLNDNTTVTISKVVFKSKTSTAATDKWYKVSTDGATGYVRSDLVDNIKYNPVSATTTDTPNYRVGAGTSMATAGTLSKGARVEVLLEAEPVSSTAGPSSKWYMIKVGSNKYYACSTFFSLSSNVSPAVPTDAASFRTYLKNQGFPDSYITKLEAIHTQHPNWSFTAKNCGSWDKAVAAENTGSYSLIQRSGSSAWVTANKTEVSYYMDPRNFLVDERIFMFENLNYNATLHTETVVNKVLSGTKLATYGFKASWFVTYGKQYNTSPVHLASRARQETGGGSCAIDGTGKYNGVVVYNPFNIGAYSTVTDGLKKAYEKGWTTKEASIKGGAEFIGKDYINAGQNTMYSQKFNIVNGKASHQYMQNIKAPYAESYSTFASYASCGILYDGHSFQIPVYTGMPSKTSL